MELCQCLPFATVPIPKQPF